MKKNAFILSLLLVLITFSVFQHVPSHDFMDWDDDHNIFNNTYLNPVKAESFKRFWVAPYNHLYTPLTNTIWALTALAAKNPEPHLRQSGGLTSLAPDVFHGLGLVIHLGNVLLVFAFLRRLVQKDIPAAAGALLFAIHPVQVESVAWATGMNNTIAAFFGLLSLIFYARWAQDKENKVITPDSLIATLAYGLALLSKPTATALPLVVIVLEIGLFRRRLKQFAPILLLWFALGGGLVLATPRDADISDFVYLPVTGRPFVILDAIAFYLGKLVWPARFCPDYGRLPIIVLGNWWGYVTGLVPLTIALMIWRLRLRQAGVVLGIFVAGALPVLGIVPYYLHTMSTVGDRFVYLSMIGPALGIAWLLTLPQVVSRPRITFFLLTLAFASLAVVSYRQMDYWQTTQSLFTHTLTINPNSTRALNNLGSRSVQKGKFGEGAMYFSRAIEIDSGMSIAQYNLGTIYLRKGALSKALSHLLLAKRNNPESSDISGNLGLAYLKLNRPEEAMREFRTALELKDSAMVRYYVGVTYLSKGESELARPEFQRALQIDPEFALAQKQLAQIDERSGVLKSKLDTVPKNEMKVGIQAMKPENTER